MTLIAKWVKSQSIVSKIAITEDRGSHTLKHTSLSSKMREMFFTLRKLLGMKLKVLCSKINKSWINLCYSENTLKSIIPEIRLNKEGENQFIYWK